MELTKDAILTEPADRRFDCWIAERVMGLVPCQNAIHPFEKEIYCHATPEYPDQGGETKAYSTDIADAWEVVEKINAMFDRNSAPAGELYLVEIMKTSGGRFWRAKFGVHPNAFEAVATSAPLAICRAALLVALEGRKEGQ